MKVLSCLLAILSLCSQQNFSMDILVTIPYSEYSGSPMTVPPGLSAIYAPNNVAVASGGSYTTTFTVETPNSDNVFVNILAATKTYNPSNPTMIKYEIKNSSNSIVTNGVFNQPDLPTYTSITASTEANLTPGLYLIKFYLTGDRSDGVFNIATPIFSPAIVSEMCVPEPSTYIMGIISSLLIVGMAKIW